MKIAFRTDASLGIGAGHVARCMTLAQELTGRGASAVFVMRESAGDLCDLVAGAGFPVRRLAGGSQIDSRRDARDTAAALQDDFPLDWVVVDHYDLAAGWEAELRRSTPKIMAIDDLADRKHDCDLLLDQNFPLDRQRYRGLVPDECDLLLGPRYALLRPEFRQWRSDGGRRRHHPFRVLISFGGVDLDNLSGRALEAFDSPEFAETEVRVVVGRACPHQEELAERCTRRRLAELHVQPTNMAELMAGADVAVGAAGTSAWERCCIGLPTVLVVIANNQERASSALGAAGLAIDLGWKDGVTTRGLAEAVRKLRDPRLAVPMRQRCMSLVDGRGAGRVADALLGRLHGNEEGRLCA